MFYKKTHIQEILNFRLKSWVNPFGKMQLVRLFENDLFYSKAYSIEKLHMKETLNFWSKSWATPFAKEQIFQLFENNLFKV